MNYLQDYIEEKQTALLRETGTFFAFSETQFNEQKSVGTKYVRMQAGMLCPKENVEALINGLDAIYKEGIKKDLKENGKEQIIIRELHNHECFISWDYEEVITRLSVYGIVKEEIEQIFNQECHKRN